MLNAQQKRTIERKLKERDEVMDSRAWNRKELKAIKDLLKHEKRKGFIRELESSYAFGEAIVDDQTDKISKLSFVGIAKLVNATAEGVSYHHRKLAKQKKSTFGFDQYCAGLS